MSKSTSPKVLKDSPCHSPLDVVVDTDKRTLDCSNNGSNSFDINIKGTTEEPRRPLSCSTTAKV